MKESDSNVGVMSRSAAIGRFGVAAYGKSLGINNPHFVRVASAGAS